MGTSTQRFGYEEETRDRVSDIRELAPRPPGADVEDVRASSGPLGLVAHGGTERGLAKAANEDHFVLASLRGALWIEESSFEQEGVLYGDAVGNVLVVADGSGEHVGEGAVSELAVHSIETVVLESLAWLIKDAFVAEELTAALCRADSVVRAMSALRAAPEGMGSTVTLAYIVNDLLYVAHVGDSRCYLFRDGVLTQLTNDHTVPAPLELVRSEGAPEPSLRSRRGVVANAIGGNTAGVMVELHKLELLENDVVLLCTDGLTDQLEEARLADVLEAEPDPARACRLLLDAALATGARDDVTAIVARFTTAEGGRSGA
jgi:protein phosphatase